MSDTPGQSPGEEATPSFDVLIDRLRGVVSRLEGGNLSLEESLKAYEEGVGLARRGHELLDSAERRVEVLTRGADGEPTTTDFESDEDE